MKNRMTWRPLLAAAALLAAMLGPATASRAQLPNLTYWYVPEWDYPFCPTDGPHTPPEVRVPAVLPGNQNTIYLHFLGWNDGTAATPTGFHGDLLLDGIDIGDYSGAIIPPGGGFYAVDLGPTSIRGGRHTLEIQHDSLNNITESNENDNDWAHQFIFSPLLLADATPATRGAPPNRFGGWSSIVDGSTIDVNCDGFRFSSTGWWNVVTVRAFSANDDYDCDLHYPSSGSENGFTGLLAGSGDIEGHLDAIVVNRNMEGIQTWDVGVTNYSNGTSQFEIEKVISAPLASGDSIVVHFDAGEYLKVWDTYIWPADAGWLTVAADVLEQAGPVVVGLFEPTFGYGGLTDFTAAQPSDDLGRARLHYEFTGGSYYGLVLMRHPMAGGAAMDVTLDFDAPRPDLVPAALFGWSAPFVPRPLPDGTPGAVSSPDTLHGYTPDTYFNLAFANGGPLPADPVYVQWYRDGRDYYSWVLGPVSLPPFDAIGYNDPMPWNVPGGRHTFTFFVESQEVIDEVFEDNNVYGEQFCWSPLEIPEGAIHAQPYPPIWYGGHSTITTGEPLYANCDGFRFAGGGGWWQAMVLNQGGPDDYDIQLFEPLAGAKNGFASGLAGSYWIEGDTDYVIVNYNVLGAGVFDAGVDNYNSGTSDYTVQHVASQILSIGEGGTFGPYVLTESRMLHLWDIYLEADVYTFALDNPASEIDFGLSLHPADLAFLGRLDVLPGGSSWLNGPGGDEWISVTAPFAGWYCLAVFKSRTDDFPLVGEYVLRAGRGPVGVPETGQDRVPEVTALASIYPNPFNPRTTIAFDLSGSGPVVLSVYDLQGALVRRLVQTDLPAGRHQAVWDGADDSGHRVASGVYMSRLEAGGKVGLRKMVMLK
jgi:hypothetical protein